MIDILLWTCSEECWRESEEFGGVRASSSMA